MVTKHWACWKRRDGETQRWRQVSFAYAHARDQHSVVRGKGNSDIAGHGVAGWGDGKWCEWRDVVGCLAGSQRDSAFAVV